jgi:hypothetical protein
MRDGAPHAGDVTKKHPACYTAAVGAPSDSVSDETPETTMDDLVRRVARVAAPATLLPGQLLDDTYELIDRLGGGGMGVVFRARDRRLGRDVAVKVLRPCDGDEAAHLRRMFAREARATAQLLHPNIVTLHHVGEHAGHPYLVLELLTGETLAARLTRRQRLPVAESLAIIDAVLDALTFAHKRGVLHRDLKPNNVFLTVDDRVKVLDFGVALTLDADAGPVTRSAGTPGYMAPEQRAGDAQDARTDVWAAALLLVECLLGRRLESQAASAALGDGNIPPALRAALEPALVTDPAKRTESAGKLRSALARAGGSGNPAVVDSASRRRRRHLAIAGAALVIGGALGSTITHLVAPSWSDAGQVARLSLTPLPAPTIAEAAATYDSNFGVMVMTIDADGRAYATYQHDDGVLVGHYNNGLFMGVWCEAPTRRAPDDAGLIEMRFARNANHIQIESRWTYGFDPKVHWLSDWYGKSTATMPPPGITARIQQHALCP